MVDKFKVVRLDNTKPKINYISELAPQMRDDNSCMINIENTIVTQIIDDVRNKELDIICSDIQRYIEENNIDTCFVINKCELEDWLLNRNELQLKIQELEEENKKLKEKLAEENSKLKGDIPMIFSKRKRLADEYEKWTREHPEVKDCPLTVISYLAMKGYLPQPKIEKIQKGD